MCLKNDKASPVPSNFSIEFIFSTLFMFINRVLQAWIRPAFRAHNREKSSEGLEENDDDDPLNIIFFSYILETNKSKFNGIGEEREERVTRVRHLENTSIIEHLG